MAINGAPGVVTNAGYIGGGNYGVALNDGGAITNNAGGTIGGGGYGVYVGNAAGTIVNAGSIGSGYEGVALGYGGSVENSGMISGTVRGVSIAGQAGT